MTDYKTISRISNWNHHEPDSREPIPSVNELISLIARIEEEHTLQLFKTTFGEQQHLYHPEQAMLVNAHLWGRQRYLQTAV